MTIHSDIKTMITWAIVADDGFYMARELRLDQLGAPGVISVHPDETSALDGLHRMRKMEASIADKLAKSQLFERQLRDALDAEKRIQRELLQSVHDIGRPDLPRYI